MNEYPARTIAAIWAQVLVQGVLLAAPVLIPVAVIVAVVLSWPR